MTDPASQKTDYPDSGAAGSISAAAEAMQQNDPSIRQTAHRAVSAKAPSSETRKQTESSAYTMPLDEITKTDMDLAIGRGHGGERPLDPNDGTHTNDKQSHVSNENFLREHVFKAQHDAALLLNFLSERKQGSFAAGTPNLQGCIGWTLEDLLGSLAMKPEAILRDSKKWAILLTAVDHLSDLARPATVESILVTRQYVGGTSIERQGATSVATRRRYWTWGLRLEYLLCAILGIAAVIFTMTLLHHVWYGQMILKKIDALNEERSALYTSYAQAFQGGVNKAHSCNDPPGGSIMDPVQNGICASFSDLDKKSDLTYLQLEVWNKKSQNYAFMLFYKDDPIENIAHDEALLKVEKEKPRRHFSDSNISESVVEIIFLSKDIIKDWGRTELRAEMMISGISNYVIPPALGLIGAIVFVFRRMSSHLDEWTLDSREPFLIILRPVLGLMLGGLTSLIFESQGFATQHFNISVGLLAFLGGYSVQFIFDLLDGIISRTTGSLARQQRRLPVPTAQVNAGNELTAEK
jgi:hypothetical protein